MKPSSGLTSSLANNLKIGKAALRKPLLSIVEFAEVINSAVPTNLP